MPEVTAAGAYRPRPCMVAGAARWVMVFIEATKGIA